MTGLIVIDESGDLGPHGSKYFAIAAIVVFRSRDLKKAASFLSKTFESKWYNVSPDQRRTVLSAMSNSKFKVVYTVVEKNKPLNHNRLYGNELYRVILEQVLIDAMEILPCKDFNVLLDRNRFITTNELRVMVRKEAKGFNINPMKIDMVSSEQNRCIQLVDFIAGASRAKYENGDDTIELISKNVSLARRH